PPRFGEDALVVHLTQDRVQLRLDAVFEGSKLLLFRAIVEEQDVVGPKANGAEALPQGEHVLAAAFEFSDVSVLVHADEDGPLLPAGGTGLAAGGVVGGGQQGQNAAQGKNADNAEKHAAVHGRVLHPDAQTVTVGGGRRNRAKTEYPSSVSPPRHHRKEA